VTAHLKDTTPHERPVGSVRGIETILAFTDLSDHGAVAVRRAAQLAAQHDAELRLVHVVTPGTLTPLSAWLESDDARARMADAGSALAVLAARATARHSIRVDTRVLAGTLLDEILREAAAADLVVLGARGAGLLRRAVLGTTAHRLLTKCDRPMLVVRQEAAASYRRILVPVDLNDNADTTLQAVLALAPSAEVHVLHAYELMHEGKLRMAGVGESRIRKFRQAARATVQARLLAMLARHERGTQRFHPHLRRGHAVRLIRASAARIDADLIVMSKRSRSKVEDILLGSVTERVVADLQNDVLVVPLVPSEKAAM
jgi:nucleotide-binding universal stress UspA family protein